MFLTVSIATWGDVLGFAAEQLLGGFIDDLFLVVRQHLDDGHPHGALLKEGDHALQFTTGRVPQILIGLKDEIPDNTHGTEQASWSLVVSSGSTVL